MAAFNAEQLNIVLSAQTKDLRAELGKAEKRIKYFEDKSKKSLSNTSKHFGSLGKAAKALIPIFSAVFTVRAIGRMVDSAAAIKDLANIAGVNAVEFQKLAAASKTVGIEQDKLSDIIKDVNDKFGDFMQTGAGPLADFFENIAPKVGVTVDQFKSLSGPQALQLYVRSLEKANLSQAEMTFYMEAIASDSTALLPLLRNNGDEMKRLGDEAERAGRILNQDAVDGAKNLQTEFDNLRDSMGTAIQKALLDNADEILAIVNVFTDEILPDVIAGVTKLTGLIAQVRGGGAGAQYSEGEAARIAGEQAEFSSGAGQAGGDPSSTGMWYVDPETGRIVNVMDLATPDEVANRAIAGGALYEGGLTSGPSSRGGRRGPRTTTTATPAASSGSSSVDRDLQRLKTAYRDLATSLDPVLAAQVEFSENQGIINDAVKAGIITEQEGINVMDAYAQSITNASLEASDLAGAMESVQSSMESAFMGMVDGTMTAQDAFKSMARDIIKELYRVLVVQRLVGSFSADGGGILGGVFNAVGGKASGGPVTAGRPYMVGEHGRELFVPQSAGRVLSVPQTKAAIGGGETIIINQSNTFGDGVSRGEINAMLPRIVETTKAAVFDAQRRSVTGRGY